MNTMGNAVSCSPASCWCCPEVAARNFMRWSALKAFFFCSIRRSGAKSGFCTPVQSTAICCFSFWKPRCMSDIRDGGGCFPPGAGSYGTLSGPPGDRRCRTAESPLELLAGKLRLRPELPWTVAEMAALCGVSSSHLHALCRKRGIPSPYVLLTRIRMELAEMLLTRTDYPVKVIASQCGYALPFSFTRAFSKHAGMSPQQFRRISIAARGGGHFTKRMRSR